MVTVPRIWRSDSEPEFHRRYSLTVDDHLAITFSSSDYLSVWPYALSIGVCGLMASLVATYEFWREGAIATFLLYNGLALLISLALGWIIARPLGRGIRRYLEGRLRKTERLGDELEMTVNKDGVTMIWRGQTSHAPWSSLVAVEENAGTFYFWISRQASYVWPVRLFEDDAEQHAFRDRVSVWLGRAISPPILAGLGDRGRAGIDLRKIGY